MKLSAMTIAWCIDKNTLAQYVTATLENGQVFDSRIVRQMEGPRRATQGPMLADVVMAIWDATGRKE